MRRGLTLALVLVGCGSPPGPVDDLARCDNGECFTPFSGGSDKLDLLFVIDDSSAMAEEQTALAAAIPTFLDGLLADDGTDVGPLQSIHVGVIDADMGTGSVTGLAQCHDGTGDDGLMLSQLAHPAAGCASRFINPITPNVFEFERGGSPTMATFDAALGCMARLGTSGCGFQQPLEAALKSLSLSPAADGESPVRWTLPGYRPPGFWPDENSIFGHGSDPTTNGEFLRGDSILAIVLVTDEDDCSPVDPEIFSPNDPAYADVPLDLRCYTLADHLHPIMRYVDGLRGLRANPASLVFAAIVGIPTDLGGAIPDVILADPRMTEMIDPAQPDQLAPACSSDRGDAFPARRITELSRVLRAGGARTTVESICAVDDGPGLTRIASLITDARAGGCFAPPGPPNVDGTIDCRLFVYGIDCASFSPALGIQHVAPSGQRACELPQIPLASAGTGQGWVYHPTRDGASACDSRISVEGIALNGATALEMLCD